MNILSAFLVAISLCMDNLAVSLAAGCSLWKELPKAIIWRMGTFFAVAHVVMFSIGFLGGHELVRLIGNVGTWIASGILVYIGLHMISEARKESSFSGGMLSSLKMQLLLSLATSIDALLVGIGLGLQHSPFWLPTLTMGVCVFLTSIGGFYSGHWLGKRFGKVVEIFGGCVLIIIALKWLLS